MKEIFLQYNIWKSSLYSKQKIFNYLHIKLFGLYKVIWLLYLLVLVQSTSGFLYGLQGCSQCCSTFSRSCLSSRCQTQTCISTCCRSCCGEFCGGCCFSRCCKTMQTSTTTYYCGNNFRCGCESGGNNGYNLVSPIVPTNGNFNSGYGGNTRDMIQNNNKYVMKQKSTQNGYSLPTNELQKETIVAYPISCGQFSSQTVPFTFSSLPYSSISPLLTNAQTQVSTLSGNVGTVSSRFVFFSTISNYVLSTTQSTTISKITSIAGNKNVLRKEENNESIETTTSKLNNNERTTGFESFLTSTLPSKQLKKS